MRALFTLLLLCVSTCSLALLIPKSKTSRTALYAGGQMPYVPFYPNPGSKDYQWMDIYNALGRKRTLFVGRFLDDESCNQLIASLIWLQGQNDKEPITMYFNVPGAFIKPALAVYDTMRRLKCPIITINTGLTVGMGALLCALGTEGQRYAFPNARFLMARTGLEDGIQGQSLDIQMSVKEVMLDNEKVIANLARLCGQPTEKVANDLKRDFYLTAPEACAYGVIDKIMAPSQSIKVKKFRGEDDDLVGFGHFAELKKLKSGPNDVVVQYDPNAEQDAFDEYTRKEMEKKKRGGRPNPRDSKDPNVRFANSRLKPPGLNKLKKKAPPSDTPPTDNGGGGGNGDKFKNTGW